MFNFNNKKDIYLTPDEELIVIRSLNNYKDQMLKLLENNQKPNDENLANLQYVALDSYFHLIDFVLKKFEN